MNKRSIKHIATFVITLIFVSSFSGTLVFASDSDSYGYANDLLRSWAYSHTFSVLSHVSIVNASYFIGDNQSGYYSPSGTLNSDVYMNNVSSDADRVRLCIRCSISANDQANRLLRLDLPYSVVPNVYDIRMYTDSNIGLNVEFWYYAESYNSPVIYFTVPGGGIGSDNINVDFYISAVSDNSTQFYFTDHISGAYMQVSYLSLAHDDDTMVQLEVIHAINNLAHVFSFQEAQFADVISSSDDVYDQLVNIYSRMASIVSNTYNDPGVVGYSAGSSYSSILDSNILNYSYSDQPVNQISGTRFVFDFCPTAKNDIISFRITFTSPHEKLLYRNLLGSYNWDFSGSFSFQSLGTKYDNEIELITFTESRNNITFVLYNPDHYSHLRIRFRTEQSMTTDSIRVSYVLNTNDYYMQYMILRAINSLDFSYPESAGDQTINNINIQFDYDFQSFTDIEFGYQQQLDDAFESVSVDSYKLSTGFKEDISFVSDLMQHMFLMTLSPEYDDDDVFSGYGSSLGIIIVISLVLIVLLAIFRRTRS